MAGSTILEPGSAAWTLVLRLDHLTITDELALTSDMIGHLFACDDRTFVNSFMSPGLNKKCFRSKKNLATTICEACSCDLPAYLSYLSTYGAVAYPPPACVG
jgi:hypothetical protein